MAQHLQQIILSQLYLLALLDELAKGGLHDATLQRKSQVQGGRFIDVVFCQSATILQLFARKSQTLLVRRNALLDLDISVDVFGGVAGLNLEGDGLSSQGLTEICICWEPPC